MRIIKCVVCSDEFEAKRSDAKYCAVCKVDALRERACSFERRNRNECPDCGVPIHRRSAKCHPCRMREFNSGRSGENNPYWKGGRTMHAAGYVQILVGGKQRYKFEHHVVWEEANGPLPKGWVIHHLNGIKTDNRLENLAGMPRHEHHKHPREALVPYEEKIKRLEDEIALLQPRNQSVTTERSQ